MVMKRVYFIVLILLQGLTVHCQTFPDDSIKHTHRKGFYLEPYLGLGTSESVQNGSNNLGGKIGCGIVYMFNEHWGISSGLQVQRYSSNVISGYDSVLLNTNLGPGNWEYYYVNANYNFTYLEFPVIVKFISSHDAKLGIFVEAGFIMGYLT